MAKFDEAQDQLKNIFGGNDQILKRITKANPTSNTSLTRGALAVRVRGWVCFGDADENGPVYREAKMQNHPSEQLSVT